MQGLKLTSSKESSCTLRADVVSSKGADESKLRALMRKFKT